MDVLGHSANPVLYSCFLLVQFYSSFAGGVHRKSPNSSSPGGFRPGRGNSSVFYAEGHVARFIH